MIWFRSRLAVLLEVTHSPGQAFSRPLSGSSCIVPCLVLGCLLTAVSFLQAPVQLGWMQYRMESAGIPAEQIASSLTLMARSNRLAAALVPLLLLLRWSVLALLIWLPCQLLFERLEYSPILAMVSYSYIPIALRDMAACSVLLMRGGDMRGGVQGLDVALGLNLLLPAVPTPWNTLLGNLNLFEAWFVALLAIGIAAVTRTNWKRGLAVALPVWIFVTVVQFGFVSLGASVQRQLGLQ